MSKNFEKLNNRIEQRIMPAQALFVKNEQTSESLGQILNFSMNGFLINTNSNLETDAEYILSYNTSNGSVVEKIFQFRATCRWKRIDPSTGFYWAGFKISHRGVDKINLIKSILKEYSKEQ